MIATLLGVKNLDFTGSDGRAIKGMTLYFSHEDSNVNGVATDSAFIRPEMPFPKNLEINGKFQIFYNKRGKVESLSNA
jgi:hypothetical protein